MTIRKINFGKYLFELRDNAGLSQKIVAQRLGIDISMLSKIEHGERHIQGHMLRPLCDLFGLNYKELQIQYLNQKIEDEFGDQPFFKEVISRMTDNSTI